MDMLDAVTLDQLRTFIAAVDEGSFSAAGRKLRRAQSVVSQTLANLEAQLGVKLFDRSARYPRLTEEGRSLLADARSVADNIDEFKARARAMASASAIAKHVQLVLTDRTALSDGRDFAVLSPLTWRLADLGAKHAFLNAGLGWGHMPLHLVKADLESGALVKIRVEGVPRAAAMPMSVVFRKDARPGPAGRAFIAQLKRK